MGNHKVQSSLIHFIILALCLAGCQSVDNVRNRFDQGVEVYRAQQVTLTEEAYVPKIDANIHCRNANLDDCGLLVTINAIDEDLLLDIRLHVDEGISFLPNEDVSTEDNGSESLLTQVSLFAGDKREIFFPYRPNNPDLPGLYRTTVMAANSETHELFEHKQFDAFIYLDEFGEYHLLPSKGSYNEHYNLAFTPGEIGLSYRIVFENSERPRRGNLLVRVDSSEDGYAPFVEISSSDAVTFFPDNIWRTQIQEQGKKTFRQFPQMNQGGSRIAKFPFEMNQNGRLLDGAYTFLVKVATDENQQQYEKMPILLEVHSNQQDAREKWLAAIVQDMSIVTPTPGAKVAALAEAETAGNGMGQGFGGKEWLDPNEAQQECAKMADVRFQDRENYVVNWTYQIGNYSGTLCQAFLRFVAGRTPMSWNEFKEQVIQHNANLNSEADYLLDHQIYVLPEVAR